PVVLRASNPAAMRPTAKDLLAGLLGSWLATDKQISDIAAKLATLKQVAFAQLENGVHATDKNVDPATRAAALADLKAHKATLTKAERDVVDAVVAAAKTFYTQPEEDKVYATVSSKKWGDYLDGLDGGRDALGLYDRVFPNAGEPNGANAKDRN